MDYRLFEEEIIAFDLQSGSVIASRTQREEYRTGCKIELESGLKNALSLSTQAKPYSIESRLFDGESSVLCPVNIGRRICIMAIFCGCQGDSSAPARYAAHLSLCFEQTESLFGGLCREPFLVGRIYEHLSAIAGLCGCASDASLYLEKEHKERRLGAIIDTEHAYVTASLLILSLMYRRLSVRRGFNFRFTPAEPFVCLSFSARVRRSELLGVTDPLGIPELSLIKSAADSLGLTFACALEEPQGSTAFEPLRLLVAICPQHCDATGLLREPDLFLYQRELVEKMLYDTDGSF